MLDILGHSCSSCPYSMIWVHNSLVQYHSIQKRKTVCASKIGRHQAPPKTRGLPVIIVIVIIITLETRDFVPGLTKLFQQKQPRHVDTADLSSPFLQLTITHGLQHRHLVITLWCQAGGNGVLPKTGWMTISPTKDNGHLKHLGLVLVENQTATVCANKCLIHEHAG